MRNLGRQPACCAQVLKNDEIVGEQLPCAPCAPCHPAAPAAALPAPARTPGMWGYSYPHDKTTTFNVDSPAPARRKLATKPTRFSIFQVGSHQLQYRFFRTSTPKSRHKTNTICPLTPAFRRSSRRFRVCSCDWVRCTRSVGITPLLFGCIAT